jgi:cation diffusion facilitator CzcD-associated flavoprotein CzcO
MEIMEFEDFKSNSDTSFVSHTEVIKYLRDYAKHFKLNQYIKVNHM